ncbi:tannase and feruloyl esterase [Penicillium antarcticum]|uniref:tannase and feruloyl esterase n=1 Tax=Penicillium antarcticum TaxID=416450 RepID=UPI00239B6863|nr:tannase and feruloyl esterase [Penicillium antarcticum]KAJ5308801.1 tannase and feruloyl esterase [Penicillium antarcticum]
MAWVENGSAPNEIFATTWKSDTTAYEVLRQRPLGHYAYQAKYNGKGGKRAVRLDKRGMMLEGSTKEN